MLNYKFVINLRKFFIICSFYYFHRFECSLFIFEINISYNSYHGENQKGKWLTRIILILFHLLENHFFLTFFIFKFFCKFGNINIKQILIFLYINYSHFHNRCHLSSSL